MPLKRSKFVSFFFVSVVHVVPHIKKMFQCLWKTETLCNVNNFSCCLVCKELQIGLFVTANIFKLTFDVLAQYVSVSGPLVSCDETLHAGWKNVS